MAIQCLKCGYCITEPICSGCALNEIKNWAYEQIIDKEVFRRTIAKINNFSRKIILLESTNSTSNNGHEELVIKCIKCNDEITIICYYCVIKMASQIVKDNLKSKKSLENLDNSFNLDLYDLKVGEAIPEDYE